MPIRKSKKTGSRCPCNSGKPFKQCHGRVLKNEAPQVVPSGPLVKYDLACGANCKDGFEGVDRVKVNDKVKQIVDLMKFPWPWEDNSVDELHCSHFIEHLPLRDVEERDFDFNPTRGLASDRYLGKDFLFAFFDECYRILKPDGWLHIVCPSVRNERAFQDPTHRRFISQMTFAYVQVPERKSMNLMHYNVACDYKVELMFTHATELQALNPEHAQRRLGAEWNLIFDYFVKMQAVKPAREG